MKDIPIWYWVINLLIFTIPLSLYMCYQLYKDLRKKDSIIKLQDKIIKDLQKKLNK